MNRKQRRAAAKHSQDGTTSAAQLFAQALWQHEQNKPDEAARLYKRVLALEPDHAEACNNLGTLLLALGKPNDAATWLERTLTLQPQLLDDFASIVATLVVVNPALAEGMRCASAAWPRRLSAQEALAPRGLAAISADPLLRHVLESTTVRDVDLERLLTSLRLDLLHIARDATASDRAERDMLGFCCALARQCFINEYVFALTPDESAQVEALERALAEAVAAGSPIAPLRLAALAMYLPLASVPSARALLERQWPKPLADLLIQQVREPLEEVRLRDSIPRLTVIDDAVSVLVRQQYEENPYPRWVHAAKGAQTTIDDHLRHQFPTAAFHPLGKTSGLDILVAGCGTGRHPIEVAARYADARVLAVDLSLASLCYAKRMTPPALAARIEYAQGDILKLGAIGRTFDLIDASGVLHHMADPFAGWRVLLSLLRADGVMRIGLYSALARRDVVAARAFAAEREFRPTADDIRRCRQDLIASPLKAVARRSDFFSTSECRDLLFHVQERRLSIPEITTFLAESALKFIGFEFDPTTLRHYRAQFAASGWSTADLDRWHAIETAHPDTFAGMYQFWVQKS